MPDLTLTITLGPKKASQFRAIANRYKTDVHSLTKLAVTELIAAHQQERATATARPNRPQLPPVDETAGYARVSVGGRSTADAVAQLRIEAGGE